MKKYKQILSEQLSSLSSSINDLSSIQTSSQDLSSFGAGNQTLTSLSATQAQAPLQTAYASGTRKGSAITQYKQGNVKSLKNYLTTNVVGKKRPVRDEDDEDVITRPDLTIVPSSIEKSPTTPFTSRDLDDAIKSGDVNRIAKTISGEYAGATFSRKDLLKSVFKAPIKQGDGPDGEDDPKTPEEKTYTEQMEDFVDAYVENMVPRISFGIANALSGLYFKVEDYEARRKQTREYLEFLFLDGDGDGIPGQIELEISAPEFGVLLEFLTLFDSETLMALYGINANQLQQFIEAGYVGDPFNAGGYPPEFVQFIISLYGI
tara:strand:- start:462 stop:1418 length:957 start_codon:yes stop_codon:yes gene_type:complete